MKKIIKATALLAVIALSFTSCDSYFDLDNHQDIDAGKAYESVQDAVNGLNGTYWALGTYRFAGRNVIALGDMASDLATASSSSGHFTTINQYSIVDTEPYLIEIFQYGYKVQDGAVRTIIGSKALLENPNLSDGDIATLKSTIGQSYALRALSTFYLTNIFGLPYQKGASNTQLGMPVLVDGPLQPFVDVKRPTVADNYKQMLLDIADAKKYLDESGDDPNQFFFNMAAIYALEARVNLFMGEYGTAKAAAQTAIDLRGSADVTNARYPQMWESIAISDEDIFTISKTNDDNLSANALNTLYGSYGGRLSSATTGALAATDIRKVLTTTPAYKFNGIPGIAQAVSNIPIFRKSEMYLIIAECEAQLDNITPAQEALFYTAKRDESITASDQLPSSKADLLTFIGKERVRELFQEGHRWYDARRTGTIINVNHSKGANYDVAKFVYPIPSAEINAQGGLSEQNPNWSSALPK